MKYYENENGLTNDIREQRLSSLNRIKLLGYHFASGGAAQALGEALKIVQGGHDEKFPEGWSSFNIAEEITEGGVAKVTGAVTGALLYAELSRRGITNGSARGRRLAMGIGGWTGYGAMVIGGAILHDVYDVHDIKWGPFR